MQIYLFLFEIYKKYNIFLRGHYHYLLIKQVTQLFLFYHMRVLSRGYFKR